MASPELRGVYIQPHEPLCPDRDGRSQGSTDQLSSSGVSSAAGGIESNTNTFATLTRKRNVSPDMGYSQQSAQIDDYEMEKIRRIMVSVDGDRRASAGSVASSQRGSIDPSLMSSVFLCVLILIFSISVYAFASLYRAVMKRMRSS